MIGNRVLVTFVTHEYLLNGALTTSGERLLDILNNKLTDVLLVDEVYVSRIGLPAEPETFFPSVAVRKALTDLVILRNSEHEAPEKRWYSYVEKRSHQVFLTLSGCHVEGTLHLTRTSQPMMLVLQQCEDFVPVTESTVTMADGRVIQARVVMVRRESIGMLYVSG